MKKCFTAISMLLVAILVAIMQIAATPIENEIVTPAAVERSDVVSAQDLYKSFYDEYYAKAVSRALTRRDNDDEPAQILAFPSFPPFPPFPPPPTFPPFPPPPTFPPFPPF